MEHRPLRGRAPRPEDRQGAAPKTLADHWILNKLSILTGAIDEDLDNFRFSDAYQKLYHFVWDDLADWYIEASKSEPNPALLEICVCI